MLNKRYETVVQIAAAADSGECVLYALTEGGRIYYAHPNQQSWVLMPAIPAVDNRAAVDKL